MKLVTSPLMRAIDRETIDKQGIPGPQLMENAGRGIAEAVLSDHISDPSETAVDIFCGKGNNGGDGFVIGRYLHQAGVRVRLYYLGPPDKLSPDARLNFDRASEAGLALTEIRTIDDIPVESACELVIDAVFGTGFEGSPRGLAAELIEHINLCEAEIIAVDMPSGLNADTGRYEGSVVTADYTYTLALPKVGLYVSPGRELSGTVETIPIGVPDNVFDKFKLDNELITPETISDLLPGRPPDGHKGDFGRLFIIAGSTGMTGAAAMTANAANRSGCGLIKLGCPAGTQPVLATKLTEVMTCPLPDVAKRGVLARRGVGEIRALIAQHDAAVIGPGMGTHRETVDLVHRLLVKLDKPTIIDADGLNNLAGHTESIKDCPAPLVLTPHPGEFRRLIGTAVPENWLEKAALLREVAADLGVTLVLKGSPTLVADTLGTCWFNQTGNSGMATGGSGDVLSGMIGSFLAQGMSPIGAALCGVFVHGLAGDIAADVLTERAMVAGDIIEFLPAAFESLGE
jgi:NAD(P)H-hydrate epimerase